MYSNPSGPVFISVIPPKVYSKPHMVIMAFATPFCHCVNLICSDAVNLSLSEIYTHEPDKKLFSLLTRSPFPRALEGSEYSEFRSFLLERSRPNKTDVEQDSEVFWEDRPLSLPSIDQLNNAVAKIKEKLLIDEETIRNIVTSLVAGKHVLLAGPMGTGKTHLARMISAYVWNDFDGGYYSDLFTATSVWTTQEVMGGIYPKMYNDNVIYEVQKGCVSDTVSRNWQDSTSNLLRRKYTDLDGKSYRGVWLIIDEFNRANIDSAFGDLFIIAFRGL